MEKYTLSEEQLKEVIEYLQGSCKSIEEALYDVTEGEVDHCSAVSNEDELYQEIDRVIFLCAACGWWCEAGDYAEEQPDPDNGDICTDCGPEEE